MRVCAIVAAVALLCGACGSREETAPAAAPEAASTAALVAAAPAAAPPATTSRPRIVVLGDSLTAGLGLAPDEAYPHLLQQRLTSEGLDYEVVNAGVSGD